MSFYRQEQKENAIVRKIVVAAAIACALVAAPSAAESSAVDTTLSTLADLEVRVERLEAALDRLARRGTEAPPFGDDLDRLLAELRVAAHPLSGTHWSEAQPVLDRQHRLLRRLRELEDLLDGWTARPERARPVSSRRGTGAIAGTVTSDAGEPLSVEIRVYDGSGDWVGGGSTDTAGAYTVAGLATGNYYVLTTEYDDFIDELYDGFPCDFWSCDVTDGTPIPVADGETTAGIDFALTAYGGIAGRVTDAETGMGIEGLSLWVHGTDGGFYADWMYTDHDGNYAFPGLPSGTYYVTTDSAEYLNEVYDGLPCEDWCDPTEGTPITVTAPEITTGIDFALQRGGSISGTITADATGAPIEAEMYLYDASGNIVEWTWGSGAYEFRGLHGGTYYLIARVWHDSYASELYDGILCEPSCDPVTGTPVAITQGQETAGIDFALVEMGTITGIVVDEATEYPLQATVALYDEAGNFSGEGWTSQAGSWMVGGLLEADYFAVAASDYQGYLAELFDDLPCQGGCDPTTGTAIAVAFGSITEGVDFALTRGGWIIGRITSFATGQGIGAHDVYLYDSFGTLMRTTGSDGQGFFLLNGLETGSYFARTHGYPWDGFADKLYDDLPCEAECDPTTGTPIEVTVGAGTGGVDFALRAFGRISGRLESNTGEALPYVTVSVHDGSEVVTSLYTNSEGRYEADQLLPGTYYVFTTNWDGYVDQLFSDKTCEPDCDPTTGTPVAVSFDAETNGVDFVLRLPFFADVPLSHWAWWWIEALYDSGITGGCASDPLRYCPASTMTRAQAAVLLLSSKEGAGYVPPPATGVFGDVPASSPFAPWIEELWQRGVVAGCGSGNYCPASPLTRQQMAVFLLATLEEPGYVPPPATGVFGDVPASSPFAPWVEELAARGITSGCNASPPLFCPTQPISRSQGAVFLVETFGMALP